MEYDLEKRTKDFSLNVLRVNKQIKRNILNQNIIGQLIRSATSVGANYREANGSISKKDFKNKIALCRKEIQETKYWIELLGEIEDNHKDDLGKLWKEAHELTRIFGRIFTSLKH